SRATFTYRAFTSTSRSNGISHALHGLSTAIKLAATIDSAPIHAILDEYAMQRGSGRSSTTARRPKLDCFTKCARSIPATINALETKTERIESLQENSTSNQRTTLSDAKAITPPTTNAEAHTRPCSTAC
ncbi:hypothetical protein AC579_6550, partial [Pseudocercospora musae]